MESKKQKRKRRKFTPEFKAEAVRLCRVGDRTVAQVAVDLDLTETALREWVKRADIDTGKGPPDALTTSEREELARLRRDNKRLTQERDILKAAAAKSIGQGNISRKLSAGEKYSSVLRGRAFSRRAISSSSAWE